MCNRYGYLHPRAKLQREFSELKVPLLFDDASAVFAKDDIRPTNDALVLRPVEPLQPGAGLQASVIRWWLIPGFYRGGVKDWKAICTNARIETVETTNSYKNAYLKRRCLVPMSWFYEWTGDKGDKTKWRVTPADGEPRYFAGLWDRARTADGEIESFSIVTTANGPDMGNYHTREPSMLTAAEGLAWLTLDGPGKAMLQPGEYGSLSIDLAPPEGAKAVPSSPTLF